MRKAAYVMCALAGLVAAPMVTAAHAEGEIRQDRRDIRQDERQIDRDQARERQEMREGDARGVARAQQQEMRDRQELARDRNDLARDRAERRDR